MVEINTATGLYVTRSALAAAIRELENRHARLQISAAGCGTPDESLLARLGASHLDLDSPRAGAHWVAGPLADSIAAGLREATVSRFCALCDGLDRVGVPAHSAREYEEALACGHSLLFAHGDIDELVRTLDVLSESARIVRLHTGCCWAA